MAAYIEKTQKELGAVITAPKLSEKLLGRPPFRFLHDIVINFIKATGFPTGLYEDAWLDSANVTDKDAKLEFLRLLIAAVEAATGQTCDARPAKIVAGSEAEQTNQMLQLLAACAALPADKKAAAVAQAKGGAPAASPPPPAAAPKEKEREKKDDKERERKEEKERERREERARREREKEKEKEKEKERERAKEAEKEKAPAADDDDDEDRRRRHEEERRRRHEEKKRERAAEEERRRAREEAKAAEENSPNAPFTGPATGSSHTATAGKAPPRAKPTHEVVTDQRAVDAAPSAQVITEAKRGAADADADDGAGEEDWMKVAERYEQKPNAPTAAVAGDVEVKGKLAQQALRAKRDQDEAARQALDAAIASGAQGGGIVISKGRSGARGAHGAAGAIMNEAELQKLREQLQLLTKASNPLGKFLEATHDDIDSMARDLETWRSEARSQAMAAAEARRQTQESLQEIQAKLQSMEDAITDQMQKTNNLRQTILANDAAIEGMIGMIIGPDGGR